PAAVGAAALAGLGMVDAVSARPPRWLRAGRLRFRLAVAALHLVQPVLRLAGRLHGTAAARRDLPPLDPLPGPARPAPGGVLLLPLDRPREALAEDLVAVLRRAGLRVSTGTGWE